MHVSSMLQRRTITHRIAPVAIGYWLSTINYQLSTLHGGQRRSTALNGTIIKLQIRMSTSKGASNRSRQATDGVRRPGFNNYGCRILRQLHPGMPNSETTATEPREPYGVRRIPAHLTASAGRLVPIVQCGSDETTKAPNAAHSIRFATPNAISGR